MAEQARTGNRGAQKHPFTMRALWRLAMWGTAAAASLLVAVLAGHSETGSQRLLAAMAGGTPPTRPNAAELARNFEIETRRLASQLHALGADRDRLAARVDSLERGLDDVTGSIKRQAAAANAPPAAAPAPPPPAEARHDSRSQAEASQAEFGVEIGGATSFEGVRALWTSTRKAHAALFEDLYPMVKVRESGRGKAVELRLIAGPLTAEAAEHVCAALADARRHCEPVAFEGQRLARAEKPPERKQLPAQRAQPAGRSAWPFR
jgi:hypothetical protein